MNLCNVVLFVTLSICLQTYGIFICFQLHLKTISSIFSPGQAVISSSFLVFSLVTSIFCCCRDSISSNCLKHFLLITYIIFPVTIVASLTIFIITVIQTLQYISKNPSDLGGVIYLILVTTTCFFTNLAYLISMLVSVMYLKNQQIQYQKYYLPVSISGRINPIKF